MQHWEDVFTINKVNKLGCVSYLGSYHTFCYDWGEENHLIY